MSEEWTVRMGDEGPLHNENRNREQHLRIQLAAEVEKVNKLQEQLAAEREKVQARKVASLNTKLMFERELDELREQLAAEREKSSWAKYCDVENLISQWQTLVEALKEIAAYGARSIVNHSDRIEMMRIAEAALAKIRGK